MERFGDDARTDEHRLEVRRAMYHAARSAFDRAGVIWSDCAVSDLGDGALILVSPEVPKVWLVESLPLRMAEALRRHNAKSEAGSRVRVRMAVHAGEVRHDTHGTTAESIKHAFRLIDATILKKTLAESPGSLVLIVSDWFYREVVWHDSAARPASYRRVDIAVKETEAPAWLALPDAPDHIRGLGDSDGSERAVALTSRPRAGSRQPGPAQLPHGVRGFAGRTAELGALSAIVEGGHTVEAVLISAIEGAAGVGKTALALHFAHSVTDRYPDGQLYVNLRGFDADQSPITPAEALSQFLRALGVDPKHLPADLDELQGLYRSVVAKRRLLVLLDNAATVEQVRPLLPASPHCLVLVTSRNRLGGLVARDGAHRITLDVLPQSEAVALLEDVVGVDRVRGESDAAVRIAALCDFLPLALRIVAERAVSEPYLTLTDLATSLAGEQHRLDQLVAEGDESTAVRAVLSWSYRALESAEAGMFRLLSLHAGGEFSVAAAAALSGRGLSDARGVLGSLARQHLLQHTAKDRFRFHDLVRIFAGETCAGVDSDRLRKQATRRMIEWYLRSADAADRFLVPTRRHLTLTESQVDSLVAPPDTFDDAIAWCERERPNLLAAVRQAEAIGMDDLAWQIPVALCWFYYFRQHWAESLAAYDCGLAAARRCGDRLGEAWILASFGVTYDNLQDDARARETTERSLAISEEIGDWWGVAIAHTNLGNDYSGGRALPEAIEHSRLAIETWRRVGDRRGEGIALDNIAECYRKMGDYQHAETYYLLVLNVFREIENLWGEAIALVGLGRVRQHLGDLDQAVLSLEASLDIRRRLDDKWGQSESLHHLGIVLHERGQREEARVTWMRALAICEDIANPRADDIRALLSGPGQ
ncbi:ATP-binding protein [Kutzneria sp. CA-103260]|uniref:ATP-binding protein n=1 Tax=Kutzneria sp. CA-103260 TaxID=2802641 RepID=UPI001BAD2A1E|nr:tetratricopeptide repeat protein [Kutzneria sp. CA-103260]